MFKHLNKDFPASIVVFFVAIPLCLGIALASGAPLFSGLIAGMVGGIVVGSISNSQLGVSGPAAGLAVIVLGAIQSLGSYEIFLVAVVIAGLLQIIMGALKAGIIGYYFPSSVIKGMLAGIGITIAISQIPNALGLSPNVESFSIDQGVWAAFSQLASNLHYGAILITLLALSILLLWEKVLTGKHKIFSIIPGPLVAVAMGVIYYLIAEGPVLGIQQFQLVTVPVPDSAASFFGQFSMPNFAEITNSEVWVVAITLAIVASLETLLSVEAIDKLDPLKRTTNTNRELYAQGTGNIISGLIGGLPVTQVIVRSSTNMQSGGRTKMSAILHGIIILFSIIAIPTVLNMIPLAVLAAVLLMVGYKLAKPALFKQMFKLGKGQFLPFIITILGVVFLDLLMGIGLGLAVGISVILINSYKNSHFLHKEGYELNDGQYKITLAEELSFLNKGAILRELNEIPDGSTVSIDVRKTRVLDYDVLEILDEFAIKAKRKDITIKLISDKGEVVNPDSFRRFFGLDVPV
ncbi:MFS superfamily sulfate permease-like transporter [Salegentibacter sp. 24]|uniref:SulP family inorganic anion transporter n=1 Tax=Salegentibacter sp. 24 TaxID=2183986 RepID=UPI001060FE6F|nr:SulP family inorganic anion transporter [Salegentibacter sp. 24]TDN88104.1 MFS superfamily sulfate permease-like transporter [Salegentibacter sp. 24]